MYIYNVGLRFESIVKQNATDTALWFDEDTSITYEALDAHANRLARFLQGQNVTTGEVVCVEGIKSQTTFALLIACLKIGAPYVVLDPESPAERLRKITATCCPKMVVGSEAFLQSLRDADDRSSSNEVMWVESEALPDQIRHLQTAPPSVTRSVHSETPAYIMYTSGSTGFPKGAVITHANVLNLIEWSRETYGITPADILTNVNPLYFDNSVFDFYASLFNGASLVPFSKAEVTDPAQLIKKIDAAECTLWFSVPSMLIFLQTMRATDGRFLRSITRFAFGGEGYPKAKLKQLYDTYKDTADFFNVYGPTECTCICSSYKLSDEDFEEVQGLPPLGNIAPNFGYLILDEYENPVTPGELGELCLLGPQVGKGYYNNPERTRPVFKQHPGHNNYHDLMYKTGDLVRQDPEDGILYVHGRKDNQIKHMGYRIELEEIEVALHCLPYVSEAVVLHGQIDGRRRLLAVTALSDDDITDERLREELRKIIPEYMVPSVYHREPGLPKNPNGKVDRRRLKEKYLEED